jgi:hypothetical protein
MLREVATCRREKMAGYSPQLTHRTRIMEAERINAIGTQLTDLTARTLELRGYL